jgi:cobalt-zinc-cadmium efflux system membrane fusion protein
MIRTLVVAAALSVVPVAATAETVTVDASAQSRAGLVVGPVQERAFSDRLRVVGQVVRAPGTTVTVKAILPGRVEVLHVAPGDRVRAGDLLVELHSHELLGIQGELLRSSEELRLARSRLEAGRQLLALEGISRQELELREQAAFSAQLALDAAREELVDLGLAPGTVDRLLEERSTDPHLPVRTPIDGVVLELTVQQHEWLQAYEPLVVVGDPSRTELELQLPPDQAASAGEGDPVEFYAVGRSDTVRATVVSRVPQVDPTTRTVRVRARIAEDAPGLYPGVFVEGTLIHGVARHSPFVPEAAVIRVGTEDVVFVRTGATTFAARGVRLGLLDDGSYEILEGLEAGEEVVVQGVFFLKSALSAAEGQEG